jgi:hypothetical protein
MQGPTAVTVWKTLKFDHSTIVDSYAYDSTNQSAAKH